MHKLELEVWPDNGPAISLYTRYGFEVEGLRRSHYRRRDGSLRSSLIMARLLPESARAQSRPGAGHVAPVERQPDLGHALGDPEALLPARPPLQARRG